MSNRAGLNRAGLSRPRVVVIAVSAAVLLLTGCGELKAGSAAIVGDQVLTDTQVAAISDEVNTLVDAAETPTALPQDELNQRIVSLWIDEVLTETLAAERQIEVSAGEVDEFLAQFDEAARTQIAAEAGIPPSQLERAAQTALLRDKLAVALAPEGTPDEQTAALFNSLIVTAEGLEVSVNPRFGRWDATIPGVQPRLADRLSTPVDAEDEEVPPLPVAP